MANETEQLVFHMELENNGGGEFESGYSLNGKPILPPMMTDWKRLEMMRLRLCALTKEAILKRNQLTNRELKSASTNTKIFHGVGPLVVMGRLRQKLEQSETIIYDHTANLVMQISAPLNTPILMTSKLVIEDASPAKPQRAVLQVTPIQMGASVSAWVTKPDPPRPENFQPKEKTLEPPKRCNTSPDLFKLHQQRNPDHIPMPQLTLAVKSDPEIGKPTKTSLARNPSRIPKPIASQVSRIPNVPKTQTANQTRRNCEAKVATKRTNQAKNPVSPAKPNAPSKTAHLNEPKSIRTPVPAHKRPGYVENELQLQKNLFQSLVLRQAEENQRLQAKMQEQHQGLITSMINELNHAVEISNPIYPSDRALERDTSSDPSQN
ncbi:uncharacterized protein [Drosophila suzukii]|uniref:Uncharacterized protein n=1 Tax=Drosophila suzukii TaxID=28584 RepID=A0AB39ZND7_DROSZ